MVSAKEAILGRNPEEINAWKQFESKITTVEKEREHFLSIMKFGGTSVGNARAIEQTAGIIARSYRDGKSIIVVASAMSGVTNRLVVIYDFIQDSNQEAVLRELRTIFDMHLTAVTELKFSSRARTKIQEELRNLFFELRQEVFREDPLSLDRKDKILSFGERLSVRILAARLREIGINARALDATEIITTDSNFGEAKPIFEHTKTNSEAIIKPLLKKGIIPVVTGFIGKTPDGETTTLGRGGSDYTASILGKVLDAKEVIIWTDVDGVYTADPNKNPDAKIIKEMTFEEADQIAKNGAKVLYSKTVEPFLHTGTETTVYVRNTFNPDFKGTRIR